MDIFIEQMIKKKKTTIDYAFIFGIIGLAVVLTLFVISVIIPMFPNFGSLTFLLAAGVVYGAYLLVMSFNLEYEYSLVNTEIDIEKIINKTRRKKMITAPIRNLEMYGTKREAEFERYMSNTAVSKVYACRDKSEDDVFFIVFNKEDKKTMLVFNPNEKIIEQIKKCNPKIKGAL